jgi:hypothetical protein
MLAIITELGSFTFGAAGCGIGSTVCSFDFRFVEMEKRNTDRTVYFTSALSNCVKRWDLVDCQN